MRSLFDLFKKQSVADAWENKDLRILIFNWRDTKHIYSGGAEVYIQEIAKLWVREGNQVTLFCGNDNKNKSYEIIDGVEIFRRGGTYTVYIFAFLYYILKFRGKYDIIIDCENGIPFFTPLFTRKPVILLIHHVHQEIFRVFLKFPLNWIATMLEAKLMPHVYKDKFIVTVSQSSRDGILKLGFTRPTNIEIIYNGVYQSNYTHFKKTLFPSFTYLGRLKDYKNIDVAIRAFAEVVKTNQHARLFIAGTGESFPQLRELVFDLNIENNVDFLGRVSEEKKEKLLRQSWVVLQPSQIEGWGITVIEANAAGTPVIASRVSGLKDSIIDEQTGLLVTQGDVTGFAFAMRLLMTNDQYRNSLSQMAQVWSRNFDWNKSASEFYTIIGKSVRNEQYKPTFTELYLPAEG